MGMVRYKPKALEGHSMMTPPLEWTGQFRVPLQAVFKGIIVPSRAMG
jgi:hypothetical protein